LNPGSIALSAIAAMVTAIFLTNTVDTRAGFFIHLSIRVCSFHLCIFPYQSSDFIQLLHRLFGPMVRMMFDSLGRSIKHGSNSGKRIMTAPVAPMTLTLD
jgi:hypothetical protein